MMRIDCPSGIQHLLREFTVTQTRTFYRGENALRRWEVS